MNLLSYTILISSNVLDIYVGAYQKLLTVQICTIGGISVL